MFEHNSRISQCNICKKEYTSGYFEAVPGNKIYVCQDCLAAAKYNFIWICLNCGKSYLRPKNLVMTRMNGYSLKRALNICYDAQIIQGIFMCIKCNPEGIMDYMKKKKIETECHMQTLQKN